MGNGFVSERRGTSSSLSKQRAQTRPNTGQKRGGKIAPGQFDRFWPDEKPVWIHIPVARSYTYEVYDRGSKQVIEVTTTWYETSKHYIPGNKGKRTKTGRMLDMDFVCSCGPHMDQPCWGCAYRRRFFQKMDAIEAETGIRPDKKPAIAKSNQFHLAIVISEPMYAIPVTDNQGVPKRNKNTGQPYYRYIPAPRVSDEDEFNKLYTTVFGHAAHWTMSQQQLDQLLSFDEDLSHHCANCADAMVAVAMICPGCETPYKLPAPIAGDDLKLACGKTKTCSECGEKGSFIPQYECPGCGDPKPGSLTAFDIRVRRKKTGDKSSTIEVLGVRVAGSPDPDIDQRIKDLINNPLDVEQIFAPATLDQQRMLIDKTLLEGLSPEMKESEDTGSESYTREDSEEDDGESLNF